MSILYMLIPLAVVLMIVAVGGLIWAIRSGQFEDLEGPAHRILMDEDDPRVPGKTSEGEENGVDSGASGRLNGDAK